MSKMSKFEYSKIATRHERKETGLETTRPISNRPSVKIDMENKSIISPSNLDIIRGLPIDRGQSDLNSSKPTSARGTFRRSQDFIIKSSNVPNPIG